MPPGGSPWRRQRLRADSLDSRHEEEEGEGARNDSMCSSDEEDERSARCVVCPLGAADGISSEVCVICTQCVVCPLGAADGISSEVCVICAQCVVCPLGAADGISSVVCVICAQCLVCPLGAMVRLFTIIFWRGGRIADV